MQIKNLTIRLKKDGRTIIDNLTFSINDGDRLALIGEEGNGKSTLLKAIIDADDFLSYSEISGEISRDESIAIQVMCLIKVWVTLYTLMMDLLST